MSEAARRRWENPAEREKLAAARRGLKPTDETRRKMSEAGKGKPKSESHRAAMRATKKRAELSPFWKGDKASKGVIHKRLNEHYPRAGVCEECNSEGPTDYAFKRHPEPYTRNREDYRELCKSCHFRFDGLAKNLGAYATPGFSHR